MADTPNMAATGIPRLHRGWRLFLFYTLAVLLTGMVSWLFADLLWRTGWSASRTVLLVLFTILFLFIALGCLHGVYGFFLRMFGTPWRITALKNYRDQDISGTSTAIVFPIYNEETVRVYEGLRATYESLEKTGQLERFDFFILSDSTNPDKQVEEERRWCDLVRELDALGRIYYRRRLANEGRKSGNVRDFLNAWGRRYRYFMVCDADSVMRGETLVNLVKLMEVHPTAGMIQTVPAVVNAESLFGRIQQFANRLYAPVFIAGLNYWALDQGNYWGHNALIRTEPFMQFCDLPQLPGRKPFGGQILSHDFVEAALMLRENREIWFAYELEGSYEEAPQAMIENAQRERRWCQGNLQHGLVLFAKGLRGVSRLHLLLGICGYLAGPLWLAFLLTYNWIRWFQEHTGLVGTSRGPSLHPLFVPQRHGACPVDFHHLHGGHHAAQSARPGRTGLRHRTPPRVWRTGTRHRERGGRNDFFHAARAAADALAHAICRHQPARRQRRLVDASTRRRRHGLELCHPAALGAHADRAGLGRVHVAARPVAVLVVHAGAGRHGSVHSVERLHQPAQSRRARAQARPVSHAGGNLRRRRNSSRSARNMKVHELTEDTSPRPPHAGLAEAVLDPYVNAIHVTLLREKQLNPVYAEQFAVLGVGTPKVRELGEKLLVAGPDKLTPAERLLITSDAPVMVWLHHEAWLRPGESLAPWWRASIRGYSRLDES